ncbi:PilZ domain-containing protein [Thalassobacillus hwangdonensis]|uniref:PilZ domain-containing protein n=1 Tax=Thalassobacillus hwangdonensis TaxID=546108 RepID=A0ABW3L5K7_9BACI
MIWLVSYGLVVSLLMLFLLLKGNRLFVKKKKEIVELQKQLQTIKKELMPVKAGTRRNFRLEVPQIPCTIEFVDVEEESLKRLTNRKITSHIEDISTSGLKITSPYNLPIKSKLKIKVVFELNNETFEQFGLLVRKEEHIHQKMNQYGVQFINVSMKQQQSIILQLNKIQAERRQKRIS